MSMCIHPPFSQLCAVNKDASTPQNTGAAPDIKTAVSFPRQHINVSTSFGTTATMVYSADLFPSRRTKGSRCNLTSVLVGFLDLLLETMDRKGRRGRK